MARTSHHNHSRADRIKAGEQPQRQPKPTARRQGTRAAIVRTARREA